MFIASQILVHMYFINIVHSSNPTIAAILSVSVTKMFFFATYIIKIMTLPATTSQTEVEYDIQ